MNIKTALIIGMLCAALTSCEKYELDRRMNEVCQKDGGVKVYETVKLPSEMFDPAGSVKATLVQNDGKSYMLIAGAYAVKEDSLDLKSGDPLKGEASLTRITLKVSRVADGKVLAEGVQYLRAGGDLIVIGHHTQAVCPNGPLDINKKVFLQELGNK
ncbi:MAG: hypothetical protein JWN23_1854 [Rhodocyclales bacterium]|nr:hypothetical protein [Rhodocyclales bacterium]